MTSLRRFLTTLGVILPDWAEVRAVARSRRR